MSTIQQLIQRYAGIYQERANQARPELTEMDFLADIARDKAIASCNPDFRCAFNRLELYRINPDTFIDQYLGVRGSTTRILYEHQARAMPRVAQRYSSVTDEDSTVHPFHREMAEIEADYIRCTLSRGIVEYLSMRVVDEVNRRSFVQSLKACVDQKPCSEVGFGQNLGDDLRCFGRTRFDTDIYGARVTGCSGPSQRPFSLS